MEIDDYDESIYPCPYCPEDYADAASIECHIREAHPAEDDFDYESCPVCSARVGNDIVDHLILNHDGSFTVQQLLKLKKAADSSGKEFHNGSSRTNLVDSILESASSNGVVDDLLPFICEMPPTKEIHNEQLLSTSSDPAVVSEEIAAEDMETASRCSFAHDLIFSSLFDDVDL